MARRNRIIWLMTLVSGLLLGGCGSTGGGVIGEGGPGGIGSGGATGPTGPQQPLPTDTCAGQPASFGSGSTFRLDAFPGGQSNFGDYIIDTGSCTTFGSWVADSVICFVPQFDCTFDVDIVPASADRVAGLVTAGVGCLQMFPDLGMTSCLAAIVGNTPGGPVRFQDLFAAAGKVVCVGTESDGGAGGAVDLEIHGLDECGNLD